MRLVKERPVRYDTTPTGPQQINIDCEIQKPENDTLGWHKQAALLGQYLMFYVETPIILGVQGDWGSGKSSFINLIEHSLGTPQPLDKKAQEASKDKPLARQLQHYLCTRQDDSRKKAHAYVLRFDSWAFAQSEYAVDDLLPVYTSQTIEDYLRVTTEKLPGPSLARRFARILRAGLVIAVSAAAGEPAGKAVDEVSSGTKDDLVGQLSCFKRDFQQLVDLLLEPKDSQYDNRLIVVVDDLDRISPVTAVDITEKIKVFLDVQGIIFILAADLSVIQTGLQHKFQGAEYGEGKNYLDKIVKIQYNVPLLEEADLAKTALGYPRFVTAFGLPQDTTVEKLMEQDYFRLLRLFPTIGSNLRNSKRVLLNFEFVHYLLSTKGLVDEPTAFCLLAVTILHQYDHGLAQAFYRWLANPDYQGGQIIGEGLACTALLEQLGTKDSRHSRAVEQFFGCLLNRKYAFEQWRAAYTATRTAVAQ